MHITFDIEDTELTLKEEDGEYTLFIEEGFILSMDADSALFLAQMLETIVKLTL